MPRQFADFSLRALYDALDAQRQSRGLSWAGVIREITVEPARSAGHQLSASTVTATRIRSVAEADGVLQMLRWLNRTPESFIPGHPGCHDSAAFLPAVPSGRVLRFDTKKLHAALDARRTAQKITWAQLAEELGLGASSLTHLAKGGRTSFPHVMRITAWLGHPAAHFTRISAR